MNAVLQLGALAASQLLAVLLFLCRMVGEDWTIISVPMGNKASSDWISWGNVGHATPTERLGELIGRNCGPLLPGTLEMEHERG